MNKLVCTSLLVLSLVAVTTVASANDARPFTEGPVTKLSFIKVKQGKFDAYVKWLSTDWKKVLDEEKKAGVLIDYKVYFTDAHNPSEADVILAETFPNMAALDGLRDKVEEIESQMLGSMHNVNQSVVDRGDMRELLGQQLIREVILK